MKHNKHMVTLATFILIVLLLAPTPAAAEHDPAGTQANSGTIYSGNSKMYAFSVDGYDGEVWDIDEDEYDGDFDINGDSNNPFVKNVDFFVIIKIKPADNDHKFLQISADWEFEYGLSAGFLCSSAWSATYVIVDMGQNPPLLQGWVQYSPGHAVTFQTVNDQDREDDDSYHEVYDSTFFYDLSEFSTSEYVYAGIWIRTSLNWMSEFYREDDFGLKAEWETHSISWEFFE